MGQAEIHYYLCIWRNLSEHQSLSLSLTFSKQPTMKQEGKNVEERDMNYGNRMIAHLNMEMKITILLDSELVVWCG